MTDLSFSDLNRRLTGDEKIRAASDIKVRAQRYSILLKTLLQDAAKEDISLVNLQGLSGACDKLNGLANRAHDKEMHCIDRIISDWRSGKKENDDG